MAAAAVVAERERSSAKVAAVESRLRLWRRQRRRRRHSNADRASAMTSLRELAVQGLVRTHISDHRRLHALFLARAPAGLRREVGLHLAQQADDVLLRIPLEEVRQQNALRRWKRKVGRDIFLSYLAGMMALGLLTFLLLGLGTAWINDGLARSCESA